MFNVKTRVWGKGCGDKKRAEFCLKNLEKRLHREDSVWFWKRVFAVEAVIYGSGESAIGFVRHETAKQRRVWQVGTGATHKTKTRGWFGRRQNKR